MEANKPLKRPAMCELELLIETDNEFAVFYENFSKNELYLFSLIRKWVCEHHYIIKEGSFSSVIPHIAVEFFKKNCSVAVKRWR